MHEFEMIRDYFRPLTMERAEAGGLLDDAAILDIPKGFDLVMSSDTLNGGVHFLENEDPAHIAHKCLRVNLSDMAAMGAKPYWYQHNLAFSKMPFLLKSHKVVYNSSVKFYLKDYFSNFLLNCS